MSRVVVGIGFVAINIYWLKLTTSFDIRSLGVYTVTLEARPASSLGFVSPV